MCGPPGLTKLVFQGQFWWSGIFLETAITSCHMSSSVDMRVPWRYPCSIEPWKYIHCCNRKMPSGPLVRVAHFLTFNSIFCNGREHCQIRARQGIWTEIAESHPCVHIPDHEPDLAFQLISRLAVPAQPMFGPPYSGKQGVDLWTPSLIWRRQENPTHPDSISILAPHNLWQRVGAMPCPTLCSTAQDQVQWRHWWVQMNKEKRYSTVLSPSRHICLVGVKHRYRFVSACSDLWLLTKVGGVWRCWHLI